MSIQEIKAQLEKFKKGELSSTEVKSLVIAADKLPDFVWDMPGARDLLKEYAYKFGSQTEASGKGYLHSEEITPSKGGDYSGNVFEKDRDLLKNYLYGDTQGFKPYEGEIFNVPNSQDYKGRTYEMAKSATHTVKKDTATPEGILGEVAWEDTPLWKDFLETAEGSIEGFSKQDSIKYTNDIKQKVYDHLKTKPFLPFTHTLSTGTFENNSTDDIGRSMGYYYYDKDGNVVKKDQDIWDFVSGKKGNDYGKYWGNADITMETFTQAQASLMDKAGKGEGTGPFILARDTPTKGFYKRGELDPKPIPQTFPTLQNPQQQPAQFQDGGDINLNLPKHQPYNGVMWGGNTQPVDFGNPHVNLQITQGGMKKGPVAIGGEFTVPYLKNHKLDGRYLHNAGSYAFDTNYDVNKRLNVGAGIDYNAGTGSLGPRGKVNWKFRDGGLLSSFTNREKREKRLYNSVTPIGYDAKHALNEYVQGKRLPFKWDGKDTHWDTFQDMERWKHPQTGEMGYYGQYAKDASMDAWGIYLNQGQKNNTFSKTATNTYRFNNEDDIIDDVVERGVLNSPNNTDYIKDSATGGFVLKNYRVDKGFDKENQLNYFDYSDEYDFDIPLGKTTVKGEKLAGRPFDIKGRIHYTMNTDGTYDFNPPLKPSAEKRAHRNIPIRQDGGFIPKAQNGIGTLTFPDIGGFGQIKEQVDALKAGTLHPSQYEGLVLGINSVPDAMWNLPGARDELKHQAYKYASNQTAAKKGVYRSPVRMSTNDYKPHFPGVGKYTGAVGDLKTDDYGFLPSPKKHPLFNPDAIPKRDLLKNYIYGDTTGFKPYTGQLYNIPEQENYQGRTYEMLNTPASYYEGKPDTLDIQHLYDLASSSKEALWKEKPKNIEEFKTRVGNYLTTHPYMPLESTNTTASKSADDIGGYMNYLHYDPKGNLTTTTQDIWDFGDEYKGNYTKRQNLKTDFEKAQRELMVKAGQGEYNGMKTGPFVLAKQTPTKGFYTQKEYEAQLPKISIGESIRAQFQDGGFVNKTGYTRGTQTANNPYNIISSGNIDNTNTGKTLAVYPDGDPPMIMNPGQRHIFPNSKNVLEVPIAQDGYPLQWSNNPQTNYGLKNSTIEPTKQEVFDETMVRKFMTVDPNNLSSGRAEYFPVEAIQDGRGHGYEWSSSDSPKSYPVTNPAKEYTETTSLPSWQQPSFHELYKAGFISPQPPSIQNIYKDWMLADKDSFAENLIEFFDPSGIMSWNDARRAYNSWKTSGKKYPTVDAGIDMFGAIPLLGKLGKIKYIKNFKNPMLAKGINLTKSKARYFPWQKRLNQLDALEDIHEDNGLKGYEEIPLKQDGGPIPKAQNGLGMKNDTIDYQKFKNAIYMTETDGRPHVKNPQSSATGQYQMLYNQIKDYPEMEGVTRDDLAGDTDLQNKMFRMQYDGKLKGIPGLKKTADDLYAEYKPQIPGFNFTKDQIAAMANLLGRQGTRNYLGYHLRDKKPLAEALPNIYGPNAKQANKTPSQYLEKYNKNISTPIPEPKPEIPLNPKFSSIPMMQDGSSTGYGMLDPRFRASSSRVQTPAFGNQPNEDIQVGKKAEWIGNQMQTRAIELPNVHNLPKSTQEDLAKRATHIKFMDPRAKGDGYDNIMYNPDLFENMSPEEKSKLAMVAADEKTKYYDIQRPGNKQFQDGGRNEYVPTRQDSIDVLQHQAYLDERRSKLGYKRTGPVQSFDPDTIKKREEAWNRNPNAQVILANPDQNNNFKLSPTTRAKVPFSNPIGNATFYPELGEPGTVNKAIGTVIPKGMIPSGMQPWGNINIGEKRGDITTAPYFDPKDFTPKGAVIKPVKYPEVTARSQQQDPAIWSMKPEASGWSIDKSPTTMMKTQTTITPTNRQSGGPTKRISKHSGREFDYSIY